MDLFVIGGPLLLVRLPNAILRSDYMAPSIFLCKLRMFLIGVILPIPIWCVCFSAFDRFCITSRDASRRRWSTPKRARITIISLVAVWLAYRSPDLYYSTFIPIPGAPLCYFSPTNSVYVQIQTYFTFPVLLTTVPMSIFFILSLRTRSNLRLFTAQQLGGRLERQMTLMVLLQAMSVACLVPYTANLFYALATKSTPKDDYRLAQENFFSQLVTLCFYAHYASPFYIYLIASSDVRRSVRFGLYQILGKTIASNEIHPTNVVTHATGTVNTVS